MRGRFALEFSLGPRRIDTLEETGMDDWGSKAAAKFKEQQQNVRLQTEAFVEQQRIKRSSGTPHWLEVREAVEQRCKDFNREVKVVPPILNFEVVPNSELSVRADIQGNHRDLFAHFDSEQCVLDWNCTPDKKRGAWGMATTRDGGIVFVRGTELAPITPNEIAKIMLNALLRMDV
jgi:hypothetical protein